MTETPINLPKAELNLKPFDKTALWEQHTFVDMKAGAITMLVPVTVGRARDTERQPRFYSSVTVQRGRQAGQLSFEIEGAVTLEDAVDRWQAEAEKASKKYHEDAQADEIRSRLAMPAGARLMKDFN